MININSFIRLLFCLFLSNFVIASSITSLAVISSGEENLVIKIGLSEAISEPPKVFTTLTPARVVLDFANVSNGLGKNQIPLQTGNIENAFITQSIDKTRIVLNSKVPVTYKTEIQDKTLLLNIVNAVNFSDNTKSIDNIGAVSSSTKREIKNIDFKRSSNGDSQVIVNLGDSGVSSDISVNSKGIVIKFIDVSLPESLNKHFDVSDFGTIVDSLTAKVSNTNVDVNIKINEPWLHEVYQSGKNFILTVKKPSDLSVKNIQGLNENPELMNLNFQNIEIRSLLQVIADFTNFNIVASDSVNGNVTLNLRDVPWSDALNIILDARNLGMKKQGNVLLVAPKDELEERTRRDFEVARDIEIIEPLYTRNYQINYAKATDLVNTLNSGSGDSKFLSSRASIFSDTRTNKLFITDTLSKLERIEDFINLIDVPIRQVLIEARIVEASDDFGRSLGMKLGGTPLRLKNPNTGGGFNIGTSIEDREFLSVDREDKLRQDKRFYSTAVGGSTLFNLPANSAGDGVTNLALSIFNKGMNEFLNLELTAMEGEGKGKIISSPRLLTANQLSATIEQGTDIPFRSTAPNGATTVEFKKATLNLTVTPQITPDNKVILDLDIKKDSIGATTSDGVAIDTKNIQTQVLVEDGGTIVIGGIFEISEAKSSSRVPILSDVPLLGNLFKSRSTITSKKEMLVFITPRLVDDFVAKN